LLINDNEKSVAIIVAQVDWLECALILSDQWPQKTGKALMFISLNVEPATREASTAALDALRVELEAKGVPVKEGSWGYPILLIDDRDGNHLFFNYPSETASSETAEGQHNHPPRDAPGAGEGDALR
jgi:hypothetical protein